MSESSRKESSFDMPLRIEEGQFLLPFRDITHFEPFDLDQADANDEYATLVEIPILFKGIKGALSIIADTDPQDDIPAVTPLGPAILSYAYHNGVINLVEAPCLLEIMFEPRSMDEFDVLRKYQAQFFMQDEVYMLHCDGRAYPGFVYREFENGEDVEVLDHYLKLNSTGDYVNLLLPQELRSLSAIRMRICQYDDEDDDEEDEIAPTPSVDSPDFSLPIK